MTKEDFIKKAKSIHGNKYDYEKVVYKNSKTKVIIICHKHGEFQQTPNDHQIGRGCKKCGIEQSANKRKMSMETFIERSKKAHGDKYDYSLVVYEGQYKKVNIVCPNHGIFTQMPKKHWIYGCKKCGYEKIKKDNEEEHSKTIQLARDFRKKHSAVETSKQFGVSQSWLTTHNVHDEITEKRLSLPATMTEEQEQFLLGNLLGDGSIPWAGRGNNHFVIVQKTERIEYLEGLLATYHPFSIRLNTRQIKKPSRRDGKICHNDWDGTYLSASALYTHSHPYFTNLRSKWYADPYQRKSDKIIPPDFKLTWRTAATWMCDDGSNHFNTKYGQRYLMLHTESFSDESVEYLIERLRLDLNIVASMNRHDGKPTIRVGSDYWLEFTNNIRPYIPWTCFVEKHYNRPKIYSGTSGHEGVMFSKRDNLWIAYKSFKKNGISKTIQIGKFNTLEDAVNARTKWLEKNKGIKETIKFDPPKPVNRTGVICSYDSLQEAYFVAAKINGKEVRLGNYKTESEALVVAEKARSLKSNNNEAEIFNLRPKVILSNTSGYAGVTYENRHSGSWAATINVNKHRVFIGQFKTKEDAIATRKKAEEMLEQGITDIKLYQALRPPKNKTFGKGVSYCKKTRSWVSYISVGKKCQHLGCWTTEEQALAVRQKAVEMLLSGIKDPTQYKSLIKDAKEQFT